MTLINYQPFYLTDRLGINTEAVAGYVFISTLVHYVFVVALSVPSGWASDRIRRRKVFVLSGALLFAAGLPLSRSRSRSACFWWGWRSPGSARGLHRR